MPGYAYPVGAADVNTGSAGSETVVLNSTSPITIFTATTKTRINSVLLSNSYGSIVPVVLYINDGSNKTITTSRVLKNRYAVQSLVTGDSRIDDGVYDAPILTELVLNAGESLKASCRIANIITVNVTYTEGVN